jgi:hypothetical protein
VLSEDNARYGTCLCLSYMINLASLVGLPFSLVEALAGALTGALGSGDWMVLDVIV